MTRSSEKDLAKSLRSIERQLEKLNSELEKRNSFWRRLTSSLLTGLGTVIGATLISGLVIYILARIADRNDWLNEILEHITINIPAT